MAVTAAADPVRIVRPAADPVTAPQAAGPVIVPQAAGQVTVPQVVGLRGTARRVAMVRRASGVRLAARVCNHDQRRVPNQGHGLGQAVIAARLGMSAMTVDVAVARVGPDRSVGGVVGTSRPWSRRNLPPRLLRPRHRLSPHPSR